MNIHFNTTTGQIMSYGYGADHGDGFETSHFPGCRVLITGDQPIDARIQRVDPLSLRIVARNLEQDRLADAEAARARREVGTVRAAVMRQLAATDRYTLADFPIDDAGRAAWLAYRKALRDCSKGNGTAATMLAAIPLQPDGGDAFQWLRARIDSGEPIEEVVFA